MRRQRRAQHPADDDDYYPTTSTYYQTTTNGANSGTDGIDDFLQMERLPNGKAHRFENTIEANVEVGDTLQALALRFNCTVADIKRLNKIDKDNEIHAHKIIKIPVTVHSVLLCSLPEVHKSGNNTPKNASQEDEVLESPITRNPLEDSRVVLSEKLMVASVNAGGQNASTSNNVVLSTDLLASKVIYKDEPSSSSQDTAPLLDDVLRDDGTIPRLGPIPGPPLRAIDWSGSDCDMSWVCLFVVILGLCFVIPLVYVIYVAEHTHHHNASNH